MLSVHIGYYSNAIDIRLASYDNISLHASEERLIIAVNAPSSKLLVTTYYNNNAKSNCLQRAIQMWLFQMYALLLPTINLRSLGDCAALQGSSSLLF